MNESEYRSMDERDDEEVGRLVLGDLAEAVVEGGVVVRVRVPVEELVAEARAESLAQAVDEELANAGYWAYERWRGWPLSRRYRISTFGRVQSCWRRGSKRCPGRWANIRLYENRVWRGGLYFMARVEGKLRTIDVARAVLEAFVGPKVEGMVLRYADGNPGNMRLENLSWGPKKESLWKLNAKLSAADREAIRREYAERGTPQRALALRYGVSGSAINQIINTPEHRARVRAKRMAKLQLAAVAASAPPARPVLGPEDR